MGAKSCFSTQGVGGTRDYESIPSRQGEGEGGEKPIRFAREWVGGGMGGISANSN